MVPTVVGHRPMMCTRHLYTEVCPLTIIKANRDVVGPLGTHSCLKNE
jgi:hypothetical protein